MILGVVAFIVPRLNIVLPVDIAIPTLPTDVLGVIVILAGLFWNTYRDSKE